MTNEEIIEKIRTTLAEEFEVDIDVIQPDAPLMETLGLSLKPWGIALKFLFLHHENILFPND